MLFILTIRKNYVYKERQRMDLGNFSVSFFVKNLHIFMKFYEVLGFKQVDGDVQGYSCIM